MSKMSEATFLNKLKSIGYEPKGLPLDEEIFMVQKWLMDKRYGFVMPMLNEIFHIYNPQFMTMVKTPYYSDNNKVHDFHIRAEKYNFDTYNEALFQGIVSLLKYLTGVHGRMFIVGKELPRIKDEKHPECDLGNHRPVSMTGKKNIIIGKQCGVCGKKLKDGSK